MLRSRAPPRTHIDTMSQNHVLWRFAAPLLAAAIACPSAISAQDASAPTRVGTDQVSAAPVSDERLAEILSGDVPVDVAELAAMQRHVQDLIRRVLPATVSLPGASGVLVERDGESFLLCAAHVTREAGRRMSIELTDGTRLRGTSLGANHQSDVSLVRVDSEGDHPTVEIGRSSDLRQGQWVLMLGHPSGIKAGRTAPARLGRVRRVPERGYLVTDCTMQAGDSGGPLFDMQGRVVGINSRINGNLATNMHAPVDALVAEWEQLQEGRITEARSRERGRRRLPSFGVALEYGAACPVVGDVEEDSDAYAAGLRKGDRMFEIDGAEVDDRRSVLRALRGFEDGDEVSVLVYRDDKVHELKLKLRREES